MSYVDEKVVESFWGGGDAFLMALWTARRGWFDERACEVGTRDMRL